MAPNNGDPPDTSASGPSLPPGQAPRRVSGWRQFWALMKKNWVLKKRHPCSLICEMILPILFVALMGALRGSDKTEPELIPVESVPVPPLSFLAEQTAFPNALCGDFNILNKCSCDFPAPDGAILDNDYEEYWFKGMNNTYEATFNTVHSRDTYVAVCFALVEEAQDEFLDNGSAAGCTAAQRALDFCPRLQDYAFDSSVLEGCSITGPDPPASPADALTEVAAVIQLAADRDAGASIPQADIESICAKQALAVVPFPDDGNAATDEESAAVAFYNHIGTTAPEVELITFASAVELDDWVKQGDYSRDDDIQQVGVGVIFTSAGPSWSYTLRANFTRGVINAEEDTGLFERALPTTKDSTSTSFRDYQDDTEDEVGALVFPAAQSYLQSGVLSIQQEVDYFILNQETGVTARPQYRVADFPNPEYLDNTFWDSVGSMFSIVIVLVLMYPVSNVIKALVVEKELKIKEGMLMMGLSSKVYLFSWAAWFSIIFFILALAMTVVGSGSIFKNSDPGIVFFYFYLFLLASVALCFFISAFFSKARTAATFGSLVFFITVFPFFAVEDSESTSSVLAACIVPTTCFAIGTLPFADYEDSGQGVTAETFDSTNSQAVSMSQVQGMLIFDIILYSFLAWYANNVVPSEWGTPRPWYFLFTSAFWCPGKTAAASLESLREEIDKDETLKGEETNEPISDTLRRQLRADTCVAIRGLEKVYDGANGQKVHAVDGLDLTMYRNQITALLGHNGAGKTTTMNMLTGMVPITAGHAVVNGMDVSTQMTTIRQDLGMCPQHDILFPDMTVQEHLAMYAAFKGVPRKEVSSQVDRMIRAVGLVEKRRERTKGLSGGQKRKLSVAIAFIGGSKVVFLDEPTSGMDPHSRRFTWNVIRQQKEGRIIVLTTHFMDEADLLGDRIAIMATGELRCCGSSLFLKKHYGVGYNLTVVKDLPEDQGYDEDEGEGEGKFGADADMSTSAFAAAGRRDGTPPTGPIRSLVKRHVPEAHTLSDVGAEVGFQLPSKASGAFRGLLADLDARREELGVSAYGMSITTLEEVFLRVAHGTAGAEERAHLQSLKQRQRSVSGAGSGGDGSFTEAGGAPARQPSFNKSSYLQLSAVDEAGVSVEEGKALGGGLGDKPILPEQGLTGGARYWRHVRALVTKRAVTYKRDRRMIAFTMLAPSVFLLLGLIILLITAATGQPSLTLDSAVYNDGLSPQNPLPYGAVCEDTASVCDAASLAATLPSGPDFEPVSISGVSTVEAVSTELLDLREDYEASIYGAWSFGEVDTAASTLDVTAHANYTALHAAPIFLNAAATSLLRQAVGDASADSPYGIETIMHPLPFTKYQKSVNQNADTFPTVVFITIGMAFIPAAWVGFIVRERETHSKHQQVVSGVSLVAYWTSSYLWDVMVYFFTPILVVILVVAFDVAAFRADNGLGWLFLLLFLFGPANAGFTYCTSFAFSRYASAMTTTLFINWVLGMLLPMATFFMLFFDSAKGIAKVLKWVLRIFPQFCLGDGLLSLGSRTLLAFVYGESEDLVASDMNVLGGNVLYLAVFSVVYAMCVLLLERLFGGTETFSSFKTSKILKRRLGAMQDPDSVYDSDLRAAGGVEAVEEDEDVVRERRRVMAMADKLREGAEDGEGDVIRVEGLKKAFATSSGQLKVAVRNMWVGIPKGECFGLLGINGAGKTTTISMLCGEQEPTAGMAHLAGVDVTASGAQEEVHRLIGYCPQFDALFDNMTGREHLELYARIKSLPEERLAEAVSQKIAEMDLTKYADKLAGTYSGGNKRKLSVAMAMLGSPEIVFLDEPSTGVDPVARRFMWDVISRIVTRNQDCALVLTTHSMEECEALCQRVGVMVGGRLRCLGSTQHLKSRFGQGYQLEATVALPEAAQAAEAAAALRGAAGSAVQASAGGEGEGEVIVGEEGVKRALEGAFPGLAGEIHPGGRGALLAQELAGTGRLDLGELGSWCVTEEACSRVMAFVAETFAGSEVKEKQGAKMRFNLPKQEGQGLGDVFGLLEDRREELGISEYALGQTSLEQIFNFFAAQQAEEEAPAPGYAPATAVTTAAAVDGDGLTIPTPAGPASVVPVSEPVTGPMVPGAEEEAELQQSAV